MIQKSFFKRRLTGVLPIALLLFAPAGWAQLTGDIVSQERVVPPAEQIEKDVETSPHHVGVFRLRPTIALNPFTYTGNVFGTPDAPVSDWSSDVIVGTHWILPFGPKAYFFGDVLPEYTYFHKQKERRLFGGTYNASFAALLNHLTLVANVGERRRFSAVSSEINTPVDSATREGGASAQLQLLDRLAIVTDYQAQQPRFHLHAGDEGQLVQLQQLDRNDQRAAAGVVYLFRPFFGVTLKTEQTQSRFRLDPERDNQSTAVLMNVSYDRLKSFFNVAFGPRHGRPMNGSTFPAYDTVTGSYFASHSLTAPISFALYGHRLVTYSLDKTSPFFLDTRNGAQLSFSVGRLSLSGFGEVGDNDYTLATVSTATRRVDHVHTVGGSVTVPVIRTLKFMVVGARTNYDSTIPEFTRSVTTLLTTFTFSLGGISL